MRDAFFFLVGMFAGGALVIAWMKTEMLRYPAERWLARKLGKKIDFSTAPHSYVYMWRGKMWAP